MVPIQFGPDEIRGRWNYQGRYDGAVVWRRVHPEITRVTLSSKVADDFNPGQRPGRVEMTYDGYWWGPSSDMCANRPSFHVNVYGKNLWGRHNVRIDPQSNSANVVDLDLGLLGYGRVKEAGYGPPSDVIGLSMQVLAWAGAVPGRKMLYVDDIAIPFDFVVHGHPKENEVIWPEKELPKISKLLFVRKSGNSFEGIEEIGYGEPFYIEAEFDSSPEEDEKTVTLDWGEWEDEKREIIVKQQKDNKEIYLSDIIYVKRPTSSKEGK